jgi:DNA-binding beta-propeller fold protein YncE
MKLTVVFGACSLSASRWVAEALWMLDIIKTMIGHPVGKVSKPFSVRSLLPATLSLVFLLYMTGCESSVNTERSAGVSVPYLTTNQPLTLVSANDGRTLVQRDSRGLFDKTRVPAQDSITVVQLGPDHPPIVKTVYGTVPNTILGSPHMAISANGRYGFVVNHTWSAPPFSDYWPELAKVSAEQADGLTVVDLSSSELTVVGRIALPPHPLMVLTHPDGEQVIVLSGSKFYVVTMKEGKPEIVSTSDSPVVGISMAVSPLGNRIVVTGFTGDRFPTDWPPPEITAHLFSLSSGKIVYRHALGIEAGLSSKFSGAFSLRFSPDGKRVLILNGAGWGGKGSLDDVLSVDMGVEPPQVTEVIPQVGDGLESLAFHPSGKFAVISCLENIAVVNALTSYSHLAVIDLTTKPARLLYHLPVEAIPEGIEFTPDGTKLFVGLTDAYRIAVFDVEGFMLKRSPFVIRVGHGPAVLALGPRYKR